MLASNKEKNETKKILLLVLSDVICLVLINQIKDNILDGTFWKQKLNITQTYDSNDKPWISKKKKLTFHYNNRTSFNQKKILSDTALYKSSFDEN